MIIAICDDEKIIRDSLNDFCINYAKEKDLEINIILFASGEEVIEHIGAIDLLLLDINLSGMNGIEVKDRINRKKNIEYIIFVSGLLDQVWNCFGKRTIGFLQKPVIYKNFYEKLTEFEKAKYNGVCIDIPTKNGITSVKTDNIIYIKVQNVYCEVVTIKDIYLVRGSLSEFENKLDEDIFFRIHKSYLINMEYIKTIDGYIVTLEIGDKLKIGRSKLKHLKNRYRDYCRRNAY